MGVKSRNDKSERNKKGLSNKKKNNSKIMSEEELDQLQVQKLRDFFTALRPQYNLIPHIQEAAQNIHYGILENEIEVAQKTQDISGLLRRPQEVVKITEDEMQIYERQARRLQHLRLISNLNKQLQNRQPEQQVPYIFSKEEHEKKIKQIISEKKNHDQKVNQTRKVLKEKQEEEIKRQEQLKRNQTEEEKQKRRLAIEEKITKQKEGHIHFLSGQIKGRKDLQKIMSSLPLFQKMEKKFKEQIQLPTIEEKKLSYKNLKEFKSRYSVNKIQQHQTEYISRRQKLSEASRIKHSRSRSEYRYQPPSKSQRLQKLLAEELLQNKLKWISKEKYVEEKIKRQQNYSKKLKSLQPKIDEEKKKQIETRLLKQKAHLAKLSLEKDQKKLGNEYFTQLKKIISINKQASKVSKETPSQLRPPEMGFLRRSMSQNSVISAEQNKEIIHKIQQDRLARILNSEQQAANKLQQIRIEAQRLEELKDMKINKLRSNFSVQTSKHASQLALNSIKAKVGLIELMKKK